MAKNITYLLGAGASYEAMPIVNQIPEKLNLFLNHFHIKSLKNVTLNKDDSTISERYLHSLNDRKEQVEKFKLIKSFCDDILWLKKETENHKSIDTLAKKLFLQNNTADLKKLKFILSCFFLYLQSLSDGFDKRYDSFLASILEDLFELPNNLKILSWNYDSQLEIAFSNFSNLPVDTCKDLLNIQSKGFKESKNIGSEKFCVYKINGTTDIYFGKYNEKPILSDIKISELVLVETFLKYHNNDSFEPTLSFAWENESTNNFFKNLSNSISETEILIVIGYSFPFFNRKADKHILDSMSKLKKVYVQDPKHSDDIIEKIKGLIPEKQVQHDGYLGPIIYEPKTFKDQFFIPIEF